MVFKLSLWQPLNTKDALRRQSEIYAECIETVFFLDDEDLRNVPAGVILNTKDALRRLFLFLARGVEGIRTPE